MTFDQALEDVRRRYRARRRRRLAMPFVTAAATSVAIGGVAAYVGGWWGVPVGVGVLAVTLLDRLFTSRFYEFSWKLPDAGSDPYEQFRRKPPELWAHSPSHGLLVADQGWLLLGDASYAFDRHAPERVTSVSYDEAAHTLIVHAVRLVQMSDGGTREAIVRELVRLDASLKPEAALALAGQLLERAAR
ncbi:MAG: hypothetical protein JNJ54_30995 [Myxococcaceae bacterium]|nr:hypothetical protein [Myxococcaceae bacterium]